MPEKIRVIHYGLGPLGRRIAKVLLEKKKGVEIVGGVGHLRNIGKDIGEIIGLDRRLGIALTNDPDGLFAKVKADIVIHATQSCMREVFPQITRCIKAGCNVVSSCEELSYPYRKYPDLAKKIDELAKKHDVTVLGTGINPGFLMDTLPLALTVECIEVESMKVTRMMYSGNRRSSYQKKIGMGMTPEKFREMISEGKITGHVGLEESIAMIADTLKLKLDTIEVLPPEPVISDIELETWADPSKQTPFMTVNPGQVCGLRSIAHGVKRGENVITLEFVSHANVKEPYDSVSIKGVPNIHERIEGGVHGDIGTVSIIINSIPKVINAEPGLVTMKDLPIPSATPACMQI